MNRFQNFVVCMVLCACAVAPASAKQANGAARFPVSFDTDDGFTLHGELVSRGSTENPIAILLHMYRHDRSSWEPLIPALVDKGITVLTLDQRTHGESTRKGSQTLKVADIPRGEFGAVVRAGPADVKAAVGYLAGRGFDVSRIGLVGASYGCSVALLSSQQIEGVQGLVLLSPGTNYFDVDVKKLALDYPGALLAIAAEDDAQAARSARSLTDGRSGVSELLIYPEGGHGTQLLGSHPKLDVRIREFLRQSFGLVPVD